MPNVLEYLDENALRRYPFKDECPLVAADGSTLSNDSILDVQVLLWDKDLRSAQLASIIRANGVVSLQFNLIDKDQQAISSAVLTVNNGTALKSTIIGTNASATIKLVVGPGLLLLLSELLYPTVSMQFSNGAAELAASTTIFNQPSVTQLNFVDHNNTNVASYFNTDTLALQPGFNVELSESAPQLAVSVGGGLGLYDGCTDLGVVLRKVNETVAYNLSGDLLLNADHCYNLLPGEHLLELSQQCTAPCNVEQYTATAHYINRIRDGLTTVADYTKEVKALYDGITSSYASKVTASQQFRPPFLKVIGNDLINNGVRNYPTLAAGIYLPDRQKLTASLQVVFPDWSLVHPSLTDVHVVPNSQLLKVDNLKKQLITDTIGFTDLTLACKSDIVYQFTLSAPAWVAAGGKLSVPTNDSLGESVIADVPLTADISPGTTDIQFILTHATGSAGYVYPLWHNLHGLTDFFTSYSIGYSNNIYTVHVELELFNSTQPTALVTALAMDRPTGLKLIRSTMKLWSNGALNETATMSYQPSFEGALDYRKRNVFVFDLQWAGDPCTNLDPDAVALTVPISLSTSLNSFTKDLILTFNHD